MKRAILFVVVVMYFITETLAQAPQSFKYQAVVRNLAGTVLPNQPVALRISILRNNINGSVLYTEVHHVSTNQLGMVTLDVGTGEVENGNFAAIDWPVDTYFIKTDLDPTGGNSFETLGTAQLLSVPYALHAESSEGFMRLSEGERDALQEPVVGMSIFNTTTKTLNIFDGVHWFEVTADCLPRATAADAGFDQSGIVGAITTLQGNVPVAGTGEWIVKYGTGGQVNDPGNPSSQFYGLPNTTYILSWVISNECGSNSDDVEIGFGDFLCGTTMMDARDNRVYSTVQIGDQCWMAENVNIGNMIDGTNNMYNDGIIEKYCYADDENYCDEYGGLYQWDESMQYITTESSQGICPSGWHVPSDDEWKVLEGTVDGLYGVGDPVWDNIDYRGSDAGGNLKEEGLAHWNWPNEGATNAYGFTALPGASRNTDGSFPGIKLYGRYWSSTESGTSAFRRIVAYQRADIARSEGSKLFGLSVRCIKD